jgi:ribose-phosphate pyrophosphokinase
VAITAKLVANLLSNAGANRVISMDMHTPQLQGFFDIPLDHLYSSTVSVDVVRAELPGQVTVASPDVGGVKNARSYAKMLGDDVDLVVVDKRRPKHNDAEVMNIIGEVRGRNIVIVDDLIDTGTTFVKCAEALRSAGAERIIGVCTHAVFSGTAVEKIGNSAAIDKVFVTDTIPLSVSHQRIEVISVAGLFAEAIMRTHENQSISSLFERIQS